MQGIVHENPNILVFLVVTVALGGSAAWSAGRAVAGAWSPAWKAALSALGLSLFVRFLHYALFDGTLLSLRYWLVDLVILTALALAGWRITRVGQMTTQYSWLYERSGPFGWREKPTMR